MMYERELYEHVCSTTDKAVHYVSARLTPSQQLEQKHINEKKFNQVNINGTCRVR